jgi:hypothetical protein
VKLAALAVVLLVAAACGGGADVPAPAPEPTVTPVSSEDFESGDVNPPLEVGDDTADEPADGATGSDG